MLTERLRSLERDAKRIESAIATYWPAKPDVAVGEIAGTPPEHFQG